MSSEERINLNIIGSFADRYQDSPTIRALLNLIPGWGMADTFLETRANEIKEERIRTFFDELAQGKHELSDELTQSEDFLHCFFITTRAALNTRRREKIRIFARLLNATQAPENEGNIDEYDEYVNILDNMSYREIRVLTILDKYESQYPVVAGNEQKLDEIIPFWEQFEQELIRILNLPPEEVDSVLIRLVRTGCYEIFTGRFFDYTGGKGRLTPLYKRLKRLIADY